LTDVNAAASDFDNEFQVADRPRFERGRTNPEETMKKAPNFVIDTPSDRL
jgi:hypothetical protein